MKLKLYIILIVLSYTLPACADDSMIRTIFGFEHLDPGKKSGNDYSATLMSLGAEIKLASTVTLITTHAFRSEKMPKGIVFRNDLLIKYNRQMLPFTSLGVITGYTDATINYQRCSARYPRYCRTMKRDEIDFTYGLSADIVIDRKITLAIQATRGIRLDLDRISIQVTRVFQH